MRNGEEIKMAYANEYFAQRLTELRSKSAMTQKELAEKLGVTDRAVSKWENALASPSPENLVHLSRLLGVTVDALLIEPEPEAVARKPEKTGMPSLTELYKIGSGPSSSHTMGPEKAAQVFMSRNPEADAFKVVLYGSLAKTGQGHGTDRVLTKTFSPIPCTIAYNLSREDLPHPNTMEMTAFQNGREIAHTFVYSIGGGAICFEGEAVEDEPTVYPHRTFAEIASYCEENRIRLWEYAERFEKKSLWEYLAKIWDAMKHAVDAGLRDEGTLPGGLQIQKKANYLLNLEHPDETAVTRENRLISAYAFAVGEQNACGERIVTAPTCGAAGVVPAVLVYQQEKHRFTDTQICHALATGGLIGNLIKTNASISGAECGCQAEVGSACAMAAAAMAELLGLSIPKIEYAAEICIEHHLGLTCDPICGLVQIPCIERNAVAAMRAINAVNLSTFLCSTRKISLDKVISAMLETGLNISKRYRETSEGGLARLKIN